ncbi:extracellular solute-binding protein [Bifidobacterium oedipodis]|uniref:ABC transporter n=1 Tax=Bifidobacterium oedipodis TaxID=2675322 RepID=A0A7Y0ESL7_9BIFI|nr:extracellular solute-binding protein [Bifidobacterium sp. DSM 109957]NMM94586.1 ABC transporter [Bifidobacterium sp. DSM 109957]
MGLMKKKFLGAIAAVGALSMVLAGCGAGEDAQTASDGKPIIEVLVQYDSTNRKKIDTNKWISDLEKDAGVHIKWTVVQQDAWGQKKSTLLAGGNVPQVSIRAFNPDDATKFPYFEELGQHLDKLPNLKAFFKENPAAQRMVSDLNGKFYIGPAQFYEGKNSQHWMINKTWLDKLGLQMPTTWDELDKVLEAFKTQDPNGNGKADEIPFNLNGIGTGTYGWWTPMLALNSTGSVTQAQGGPWQQGITVKDGKVGSWMTSDNLRQVIEWYSKLFGEGLIPKDALSNDVDELPGTEKDATVGVAFTYNQDAFGTHGDEYVSMPTPKADASMADSDVVWDASGDYGKYENYHLAIKKDAPNMDAVLKLVNLLYSEKYSVQQYYGGISDGLVKDDGNHTYTVSDKVFADTTVSYSLGQCFAGWFPNDVKINGANNEKSLAADAVYDNIYKNYDKDKDAMPIWVKADTADQTTISNNTTNILNYANPQIAKWMKGDEKITDASWQQFVDRVNKLGMEQNVQLWQKWYDKYQDQKVE